jgi:predicted permease
MSATWRRSFRPIRSNFRADVDEEIRFHIDMDVARLIAEGWGPREARVEAERRFGPVTSVEDACITIDRRRHRRVATADAMSFLAQDLRFGFRMLRRTPGVSLLAILCLTVAIGANAAVYSWVEGILLRPYALVANQDRLVALVGMSRGTAGHDGLSWPDLIDLRKGSTLIEAFMANNITGTTISTGDRADHVTGGIVSSNYFNAIGVRPMLGRGFEPGEDVGRGAHPVTVISYQLWKERFNGDPGILGRTLTMNGVPHTIIGITPEGFVGTFVGYAFHFWVPPSQQDVFDPTGYKLEDRGARWIEGMVRLKPGVTRAQAQTELTALAKRLESQYPNTNRGRTFELVPLWKNPFNNAGTLFPTLRIAFVVVSLVLLIACANVGNLLLVRAFARRREMMVRLAIGAERSRLVRQLLTEGLILSAFAAAGGLLLAYLSRHALVLFFPPRGGITYNFPGEVDWRVLGLSVAVCLVSTVLFALVPALQTSKIDLAAAIKAESTVGAGGRRGGWLRSGLVLVQVSLSFVLLVGAGLLIKSLQSIQTSDPGFSTDRVLVTSVNLAAAGYDTARAKQFQDGLIERLRTVGGVESVAYSRVAPFSYRPYSSGAIAVDGFDAPPDQQPTALYDEVGPSFFSTMSIPLASGREFTRDDTESAPLVAVVNETMAARFWRGESPIGRRLQVKGRWMQVVGVAKNAKYGSFMEAPKPFFYVPLRQNFSAVVGIEIRTTQRPDALGPALLREIHALDPNLAPGELITMREQVGRTTSPQRAAVALLEVFGALALLLAAIGLYGVMSYAVSQSTRELGLRMALGAGAPNVVRLVMRRGLVLTGAGIVLGAAAAIGLTRLLGDLLYRVSPRDPLAFGVALAVMVIASTGACFVPAWRATRIDPLGALRQE